MKLFKKIFVPVLAAVCVIAACAMFAACGDDENGGNEDWDYKTYTVYLKLPDGSAVSGVSVEICSDGEGGGCHPLTSDSNGKVTTTFEISRESSTVYIHFSSVYDASGVASNYEGPDGYTLPEGGQADYDTGSVTYHHVWFLTQEVTTLTFVAQS